MFKCLKISQRSFKLIIFFNFFFLFPTISYNQIRPGLPYKTFKYILIYTKQYTEDDIYLNSRTFLWPNELEQVLELSGYRLSVVRDNLEAALR